MLTIFKKFETVKKSDTKIVFFFALVQYDTRTHFKWYFSFFCRITIRTLIFFDLVDWILCKCKGQGY